MIRFEARAAPSRLMGALSPVIALALTVAVAAVLFAVLGKEPARGLQVFLVEPFNGTRALTELGLKATPLILCSLGLALCFRSNVWNIGAEGQFLLGAIGGGGVALWETSSGVGMSPWAFFPLLVVSEELDELFELTDRLHVAAKGRLSPSIATGEAGVEQIGEWMSGLWPAAASDASTLTRGESR